ncbi:hemin-degrading factor [Paludibacterium sp. B53371]|uniref:hemin-degrading factor n=1 Tax=Paludibacterium sp. B53371 TaxID=2806263 RepID=UPI001C051540|nr:ChuX/HutX family heme-like substrate-binding protein [Paludibacterium sp. B53371]
MDLNTLRQQVAEQRQQGRRQRDIAATLGVTEAHLIDAHTGAPQDALLQARRLDSDWPAIFSQLATLGQVMALTRNEDCVHEKTGVYRPFSHGERIGLVLDEAIDLRIFFEHWAYGYRVSDLHGSSAQHSLQFYDHHGRAIHKIYLRPDSDQAAWQALCQRFEVAAPAPLGTLPPAPPPEAESPDSAIDVQGLHQGWADLRDTHDFFALLKQYGVSRRQGLRLAEARFARPLEPTAISLLLREAALRAVPIMVFTGNPGMIQIHTGPVQHIVEQGPWINVMDEGFNLHLRQDRVAEAWLVKKPTRDGLVCSLELFDAAGETIAMLFGARKPGLPERSDWRALLDWLQDEATACTV